MFDAIAPVGAPRLSVGRGATGDSCTECPNGWVLRAGKRDCWTVLRRAAQLNAGSATFCLLRVVWRVFSYLHNSTIQIQIKHCTFLIYKNELPTEPPYGVMGNTCVVPRSVDTATHLESGEKHMSCTLALVSPRCNVYKWWTAPRLGPPGCGCIRNRWKSWPRLSAVNSSMPLGSNCRQTIASE